MNQRALLTFSNSTMKEEEEENYVSCTNNMTNSTAIVMEEDEEQDNYERMIKIYVLGAMFIMTLFGNGLILVGVKTKNYVWSFLFLTHVVSTIDTQFYHSISTEIFIFRFHLNKTCSKESAEKYHYIVNLGVSSSL